MANVHPVSQQVLTLVPVFTLESLYIVVTVMGDESLEALIAMSISFTISGSISLSSRLKLVFTALLAEKTLLALALLGSSTSALCGLSASESDSDTSASSPASGPSAFLAFFFLFLLFFFFFTVVPRLNHDMLQGTYLGAPRLITL